MHTNKEYQTELIKAMEMLGKDSRTIFLGQTVKDGGSPMFQSLRNVPEDKKLELPVFEETQMGMTLGLALGGYIPISIFPRIDFMICGINQLVNHADKAIEMSHEEFSPGVIIRTQIGNKYPLYPGPQHCQDHTSALKKMCKHIEVIKINKASEVFSAYEVAIRRAYVGRSTLLIEIPTGAFIA